MGFDNPTNIIFLVVILLLVFGAKRLPEIGRSLGIGLREFKQSINGEGQPHTLGPGPQHVQAQAQAPVPAAQAPPPPPPQQQAPAPPEAQTPPAA